MSDGTRQRTLGILRKHELNVSELVEVLQQPQSTVSRHLRVLREAGLLHDRRDGNTVLYSAATLTAGDNGADLSVRLLGWIDRQPLSPSVHARLAAVIERRRDMSERFFDRIGRQWDVLREESFGPAFHLEAFLSLLPRDWRVVDVGTGTGYLLPTLARHFDHVVGVEPVDRMLETARRRVVHHGLANVELRAGDLAELPIDAEAADLAIAVLVLHHVPTPRDAMAELFRIVRDGGRVLIVEQNAHHNEAFRERMQDRWWGFVPTDFADMLISVGFHDVRPTRLVAVETGGDVPDLFAVTGQKPETVRVRG